MSKATLLRSLSIIAVSVAAGATHASAQAVIQGGGATAAQGDYAGPNTASGQPVSELSTYNAGQSAVQFSTYWGAGSGTGQTAFINNDLTCDINKVNNINGGKCSNTPGGADTVHYAFSETALNATQVATWSTASYGQAAAGNLIQLPIHGTGSAIVVVDTNVTASGQAELTDNDLCEIFSGGYTDFSQITDVKAAYRPAPGPIALVYRSDTSGQTTILTEHLSKVCTAANTLAGFTFTATNSFASLFTGLGGIGTVIPHAVGQSGSLAQADYLSGLSGMAVTQAVSYLSPDWTDIPPAPDSLLSNGNRSLLHTAALFNGTKAYTPTAANIQAALARISAVAPGSPTLPPTTAAAAANPLNWVPIVQKVTAGYPIVGFGTADFAQCYASKTIAAGVIGFLKLHYTNATYQAILANNGLVSVTNAGESKFLKYIEQGILTNVTKWNTDIGDTTVCVADNTKHTGIYAGR